MSVILTFLVSHFSEAILIFATGMLTKALVKSFGKDRTNAIKEAVVTAMLYAEELFGIGHGSEKWSKSWQLLVKLLSDQGIKLTEKEIINTTTLMKATVPEVNAITYASLPDVIKSTREISFRTVDTQKIINDLKKKHKVKKS